MNINPLLIVAICTCILAACQSTTTSKHNGLSEEQLVRKDYVSGVDKTAHQYFVYLPRGYTDQPTKKWPVILFLHGNGERGDGRDDLDYVLAHGPAYEAWIQKKDLPFIIISPQLPMFGMDKKGIAYIDNRTPAQIPQRLLEGVPARGPFIATQGPMRPAELITDMQNVPPLLPAGWEMVEQDLLNILASVQQDYPTDAARIYLTGLSYGGFGTWYMASKYPDLFAAIAPVVGWGHPDLMTPIAQYKIPVWAFAGGRDTSVNKKFFYAGLNKLDELGHPDVRFTVEEDMAHDAWKRVYAGEDLYQWFLTHTKKQ
ncbi:MAG: prolyl oligopeptidase family serine peptidase [Pseudomonadota bacterium]